MFYIPGVPHLSGNLSDKPASAVIARTDPNEQKCVALLPELVDIRTIASRRTPLHTGHR
jgi:uncharacterized RmlC-like cupin family protein